MKKAKLALSFAATAVAVSFFLVAHADNESGTQKDVIRILFALSVGGLGAALPGVLSANISRRNQILIRASGGVAFFLFAYLALPAIVKFRTPSSGNPNPPRIGINEIPKFPWPPPEASAIANLPPQFFTNAHSLADIEAKLSAALASSDYIQTGYYAVPAGFALVTRIEQINNDGTPKPPPGRWAIKPVRSFNLSLGDYIKALFEATPGRFRVIVFVVTKFAFTQTSIAVTREEAMQWLSSGGNRLPHAIGDQPYTADHICTALIYEFEMPETRDKAILNKASPLTAKAHLTAAKLWKQLEK
jgi:hypothetical protein